MPVVTGKNNENTENKIFTYSILILFGQTLVPSLENHFLQLGWPDD
jgi:hypothetical protein